jgi:transposase
MEQRYDAVLGVIKDGFSVTEVARKINVSRQTVHSWMARYIGSRLHGCRRHEDLEVRQRATDPHHGDEGQVGEGERGRLSDSRRVLLWGELRLDNALHRGGHGVPALPDGVGRCVAEGPSFPNETEGDAREPIAGRGLGSTGNGRWRTDHQLHAKRGHWYAHLLVHDCWTRLRAPRPRERYDLRRVRRREESHGELQANRGDASDATSLEATQGAELP